MRCPFARKACSRLCHACQQQQQQYLKVFIIIGADSAVPKIEHAFVKIGGFVWHKIWHNLGTDFTKLCHARFASRFGYNAAMNGNGLSAKQLAFVSEYLKDLNATKAAIRAGYSPKTAHAQGSDLLRKPELAAAIQEGQQDAAARNEVTVDRIVQEYARIAFADVTDYVNVIGGEAVVKDTIGMTKDQTAAIAEISQTKDGVRLKLHDKGKALDALGKHLGMFVERFKDETPDGPPPSIRVLFGPEPEDASE